MLVHRSILRATAATATVVALTASALVIAATPTQAAAAPGGLVTNIRNSSTVILSWKPVKNADSYEVQVDASSSFSSPDYSAKTSNTKSVPTKALVPGKNYWRVRSIDGSDKSAWSTGDFEVAPVTVPIPLSPGNGAPLNQPGNPPLLQWSSSQGAISYTVQLDADSDMIGAKSYSTKTTSLVVPDPLTTGDWFWRVIAVKSSSLISLPSVISSFVVNPVPLPTLTSPVDDVNAAIEDVVLDWDPVPGAKTYDLQIATDDDFNNVTLSTTDLYSTRYSPATTIHNAQFFWRVRAVDLAGQETPWTESKFGFKRQWLDKPSYVFPQGTSDAPGAVNTTRQFYEWTPVQHATYYELYVASNASMAGADMCKTAGTTYVPRNSGDCGYKSSGTTYWQVRPMDKPYPGIGVPGTISIADVHAFDWTNPGTPGGTFVLGSVPDGLKVAINGTALTDDAKACSDVLCTGVPATPIFAWNPVVGATSYRVHVALDENFTFKALDNQSYISTTNTAAALQYQGSDDVSTMEESTAGSAYFWYVVACGPSGCGTSPVSQDPSLPGVKSFRKESPAITSLDASNLNGTDIVFSWQDYIDANNVPNLWRGQTGTQSAQNYRIQVDNDVSFASPIDTATVDQTTYTAPDQLYPEGTYFWRVQARDADGNGLTWSDVATFKKESPAVTLSSPVAGAAVPGTTPFRWAPQPFAAGYTVELYKNNDQTFSSANRIFSVTAKTPAYTPQSPVPASSTPYLWRVRRIDTDGNAGPWSSPASFLSTGAAPSLLSPQAGIWLKHPGSLFEWSEVPGAASYALNITGTSTSRTETVATAYAPGAFSTGTYTWSVTAYDGADHALATSPTRQFKVDRTAPKVKKLTPEEPKAKSVFKAVFTEKVRGVSGKSWKLYFLKGEKQKRVLVKAKVKVLKKGKAASLDPKGSLKHGDYVLVFVTKKITDVHGNKLVADEIEFDR